MGAIIGAAVSLVALLAAHLGSLDVEMVSQDIVIFASGEMAWLIGVGMTALALSAIMLAFSLPERVRRNKTTAEGRVLLIIGALALIGTGVIVVGDLQIGDLSTSDSASLALASSSVLITAAMVMVGSGLDLTLHPDNTYRRFRVLALLAAMLLLLFFLTWGTINGLFQRAFFLTVGFWLVTSGSAVLNNWRTRAS